MPQYSYHNGTSTFQSPDHPFQPETTHAEPRLLQSCLGNAVTDITTGGGHAPHFIGSAFQLLHDIGRIAFPTVLFARLHVNVRVGNIIVEHQPAAGHNLAAHLDQIFALVAIHGVLLGSFAENSARYFEGSLKIILEKNSFRQRVFAVTVEHRGQENVVALALDPGRLAGHLKFLKNKAGMLTVRRQQVKFEDRVAVLAAVGTPHGTITDADIINPEQPGIGPAIVVALVADELEVVFMQEHRAKIPDLVQPGFGSTDSHSVASTVWKGIGE